jgi:hypothetical protein
MFDPTPHWRTLQRNWRMQAIAGLVLPIALVWVLDDWDGAWETGAMPIFIFGLVTVFLSIWRFRPYKLALIEAEGLGESAAAEAAWATLHQRQLMGLMVGKIPGWIGLLHYVATGEVVPLVLLALATQGILLLYRPPSAWVK